MFERALVETKQVNTPSFLGSTALPKSGEPCQSCDRSFAPERPGRRFVCSLSLNCFHVKGAGHSGSRPSRSPFGQLGVGFPEDEPENIAPHATTNTARRGLLYTAARIAQSTGSRVGINAPHGRPSSSRRFQATQKPGRRLRRLGRRPVHGGRHRRAALERRSPSLVRPPEHRGDDHDAKRPATSFRGRAATTADSATSAVDRTPSAGQHQHANAVRRVHGPRPGASQPDRDDRFPQEPPKQRRRVWADLDRRGRRGRRLVRHHDARCSSQRSRRYGAVPDLAPRRPRPSSAGCQNSDAAVSVRPRGTSPRAWPTRMTPSTACGCSVPAASNPGGGVLLRAFERAPLRRGS